MIYNERDIRRQLVVEGAKRMVTAARTAPKAKGCDIIEVMLVTDEDIQVLSNGLREIGLQRSERNGLVRDAENILSADAVVLIGSENIRNREYSVKE